MFTSYKIEINHGNQLHVNKIYFLYLQLTKTNRIIKARNTKELSTLDVNLFNNISHSLKHDSKNTFLKYYFLRKPKT